MSFENLRDADQVVTLDANERRPGIVDLRDAPLSLSMPYRSSVPGEVGTVAGAYGELLSVEPKNPIGRTSRGRSYFEAVMAVRVDQIGNLASMDAFEDMQDYVQEWTQDKGPLLFITHQWTSYLGPDHTGAQMSLLQRALANVHSGNMIARASNEASESYLKLLNDAVCDPRGAWIWCDHWSIPQREPISKIRAIYSIAAYLELAAAMICICPPTAHEQTGNMCNFDSWARRGWCRLERLGFHLNRYRTGVYPPLYVFNGVDGLIPFAHGGSAMGSQFLSSHDSIFNGEFACCELNHMVGGKRIGCDKIKL